MKHIENEVCLFYLDRPSSANALNLETARGLQKEGLASVKRRDIGMIIASRNPKVFCAGGDLRDYSKMKNKSQGTKVNSEIRKVLGSLSRLPLLMVAAVEGNTVGGGCELALACDWIVASQSAVFFFKQVYQHLTPGWGGGRRLMNRVSPSIALDWLTSGRPVSAAEAFRQGLVDQLCRDGNAVDEARNYLKTRAPMTQNLLKAYKQLVTESQVPESKLFDKFWFGPEHRKILKSPGI